MVELRARIVRLLNPPRPHRCPCTRCRQRRGAMTTGRCWIDGRHTTVEARYTILPGVRVTTCADGNGCDTWGRDAPPCWTDTTTTT